MFTDKKTCSLWIMVARTDVSYMMHTIPHLIKMCNFPFFEKVLALDTAPLSGDKCRHPYLGSIDELYKQCNQLKNSGVIDRMVEIDYSDKYRKRLYKKHLGTSKIKKTHNYKGYPILGSMFCIEEAKGDYLLHFDSDMLIFQKNDFDWISKAIDIMEKRLEIFGIRATPGPIAEKENFSDNLYEVPIFGSRCYLINRERFNKLLPLKVMWAKRQGKKKDRLPRKLIELINNITGDGILDSWERMVTITLKRKSYVWAYIKTPKAWTLHPHNHGNSFIKALPSIIERIEKGWFPPEQLGKYNLQLEHWT